MEKLFGLEMTTLAGCLGGAVALVLAGLALFAWRRPVMFKLGLRPIGRRRAQSTLIVLGLMLATLIITSAFVTGDTLSHTIRTLAVEGMGEMDEVVRAAGSGEPYFNEARYQSVAQQLAGDPQVDHVLPAIRETVPAVNVTSRRSLSSLGVMGLRPEDLQVLSREEVTDAQGAPLALEALGPQEVYLNAAAAEQLAAQPGHTLELYIAGRPKVYTVRAIAAQGQDPRLLLSLKQAQALFNKRGKINMIVISNAGDALGGVRHSQAVTARLRGLLSDPKVAAQVHNLLRRGGAAAAILRRAAEKEQGNTQQDLRALAAGLDAETLSPAARSLLADEGLADRVQSLLADADWGSKALRERLAGLYARLSELAVDDSKRDVLDQGELAASAFTTIFIVAGLFGIAAGLILIFLIFVMLAAERKSEMGMARAVGAQRGHLVEMFTFEGAAYDLTAAAVGVALGIGVGLVIAMTLGQAFAGGTGLTIQPTVTARSLVVSYGLGLLVTFATVLAAANQVSRLNIVAAIRDLPDPPRPPTFLRDRLLAPFRAVADGFRALARLRVFRALRAWLVGVPGSLWRLVWLGFREGPLTFLLGLILFPIGIQQALGWAYSVGASLLVLGGGLTLRAILRWTFGRLYRRWPRLTPDLADRLAFTLAGGLLALFWSLPFGILERRLGVPELSYGPEMLFISGILLVTGAVLVVMYNTDLLLRVVLLALGGAPRLAPVLRMAVAYPLSNRFRTGMTVGIFAVVVFSVIFMATVFRVNDVVLQDTEAFTGGFNLRVSTSRANPLDDLAAAIARQSTLRRADYAVVASQATVAVEARQERPGQAGAAAPEALRWKNYYVQAVDDAFLEHINYDLSVMAAGYATAADVWRAVRDNPGYAVVDRLVVPSRQTASIVIGGPDFRLEGVYLEDKTMRPLQVQVRDPATQASLELTVIGVLEQSALTGFGLMVSRAALEESMPDALPAPVYYIRLAPGVEPAAAVAALESAFLKYGLEATDQVQELRDGMRTQVVFQQLLLGFLTLGLVVGVAALGVISTRSVVERRQQIGMLRALGFQREMVAWSFLIESSFVALLGIGLGIGLGLIPAYNMIVDLTADIPGIQFQVPWIEISVVFGLAYGMALLTTWLPAVQASQVLPAEALRYE